MLVWLPYLMQLPSLFGLNFSSGFSSIYRNYDGLEYVIIAKSFYNPSLIAAMPQSSPAIYYASHFPLYPLLIFIFSFVGFLKSMIMVSFLFTVLSAWIFYLLVRDFKLTHQPLWLSIVFLLLPARWLIVHSVGSPEPLFIFFIISSIYALLRFERDMSKSGWVWVAAVSGLLAQLARPPGILLFISYILYIHWRLLQRKKVIGFLQARREHLKYAPLILIPLGLLAIFFLYLNVYGDFWAYFHSGDNIHLTLPPYQVFNKHQFWVGDIWLEDIIYIFILGFLGGLYLIRQKLYPLAFFTLTYFIASTLIAHRDISRYTLPVIPFVLISLEKILISREFKIVLVIVGCGIYLYAQNFILNNTAPTPNLELFN